MKLQLPTVTLIIYNPDKDANLSAKVLNFVCSMIDFGAVKHLCSKPPTIKCVGETVLVPFGDWEEGQIMQSYLLNEYFDTEHLMHIETDGYPVNVDLWENEFLRFDYVGAPWPCEYTYNNRVGNAGFSIQSKRFRQFLYDNKDKYPTGMSSDIFFCQFMFEELRSAGITFAPLYVAQRFSFELPIEEFNDWDWKRSFGFHGKFKWLQEPLAMPEEHHFKNMGPKGSGIYIRSTVDELQ